jgi:hypothetical protein
MGYGILALFAIGAIWLVSDAKEDSAKNILDHYEDRNQP